MAATKAILQIVGLRCPECNHCFEVHMSTRVREVTGWCSDCDRPTMTRWTKYPSAILAAQLQGWTGPMPEDLVG